MAAPVHGCPRSSKHFRDRGPRSCRFLVQRFEVRGWRMLCTPNQPCRSTTPPPTGSSSAPPRDLAMGVIARLDPAHFSSIRQVVLVSDWERLRKHEGPATSAALHGVLDRLAGRLVGRGVFRAEKIEAGMKETVARGRWPWKAPIGYRNDRSPDGRKIVVPDEQARLVPK